MNTRPFDLEVAWKRPLGSGYSSISVAGDRGVTLFTEGDGDYVTAFHTATGEELWRYRIGEKYAGHDGSSDGPMSTPAIGDGMVYALGPRGDLLALDLADGRKIWSYELDGERDSRAPQYGYATSPLTVDDLLIIQTGGPEGHSITAFDRTTGEMRWSAEDDSASYQSPIQAKIFGRRQLIIVSDHFLSGVAPKSGEVLWKHRHTEEGKSRGGSGHPVLLDENQLLIRPGASEIALFQLANDDGRLVVSERWHRDQVLKRSHAAAIFHEGYLYSFDAHYLVCLDARTGVKVWKSRPPGGRGSILIDGHLVILSTQGDVVFARADPAGYEEVARVEVFERGDWAPPSFADGQLFVRNLTELASVRIIDAPAGNPRAAGSAGLDRRSPFRQRLRQIEEALDKDRLVDELLAARESFPVIEDGDLVHLVYRGNVDDVAYSGNMTEAFRQELSLERIAGTDLFVATLELDPAGHYEYRFHVDFGGAMADPRNPHPIGSIFGPSSELRMPLWKVPDHLEEPGPTVERGRLFTLPFASQGLGDKRSVRIYLPAGYERSEDRYPLLIVQEGEGGASARMERTLDNLIGRTVSPIVVAFLPRLGGEHDLEALSAYASMVHQELIPTLEGRYRILAEPQNRGLMGAGSGAAIAAFIAFEPSAFDRPAFDRPGAVGKLALQSFFLQGLFGQLGAGAFSMTPDAREQLMERIRSGEKQSLDIDLEWSAHDSQDPSSGLDVRADTRRLLSSLEAKGYAVHTREVSNAPGWGSWRSRNDRILELFFPF